MQRAPGIGHERGGTSTARSGQRAVAKQPPATQPRQGGTFCAPKPCCGGPRWPARSGRGARVDVRQGNAVISKERATFAAGEPFGWCERMGYQDRLCAAVLDSLPDTDEVALHADLVSGSGTGRLAGIVADFHAASLQRVVQRLHLPRNTDPTRRRAGGMRLSRRGAYAGSGARAACHRRGGGQPGGCAEAGFAAPARDQRVARSQASYRSSPSSRTGSERRGISRSSMGRAIST